ncbi:MAG: competence/damage-inducible protein A [Oscillospiraceae bacterium]|jgi:nicotinamide-nucleotide amidase|nr:competence/damage-inducible protein A [Oscillospiraceae bacterium]
MIVCELISVGTELLLGEITNTNARFLAEQMAAMGIAVERQCTVGDNPARLREDFLAAWERSGIVILTGGLGPTADDITKEVICEALGLTLEADAFQMGRIEAFFRQRGLPMGESNRKQAMVPAGCVVLPNENGTAPGCWIQKDGKCAALLPGPPREMQPLFLSELKPRLAAYASGVIVSHHLRTIGLGESRMAELAQDYLDLANPTVAPYAKDAESYLRVSAAAPTQAEAEALCRPILKKLKEILGEAAYSVDKSLEQTVIDLLRASKQTVALAESCTGGGIAARLTDVPGASDVFGWGVVSYSNDCKQALLGVQGATLARHGAVSAECAREMAQGILTRSGADFGLAVTGIAGPGSDGTAKEVGLIYLAVADRNVVLARKLETGRNDREYNRIAAAKQALALLRELLLTQQP